MTAFLLDTHLLLWAVKGDARLPRLAHDLVANPTNAVLFSAASIWEIAIKSAGSKAGFNFDPSQVRTGLLDARYREVDVTSEHGIVAGNLPLVHRDPFDRMLIAQADVEGATLLTMDREIAAYSASVRLVR